MFDKQKSVCAIQSLLISFFYSKNEAFVPVNMRLLCLHNHVFLQCRNSAPDTATPHPHIYLGI